VLIQSHKFKPRSPLFSLVRLFKDVLLKVKSNMTTENMPKKKSNMSWIIAAVVIVIVIIVVGVVAYQYIKPGSPSNSPSPTASPSTTPSATSSAGPTAMTIYSGEKDTSTYGFGSTSTSINSPGPSLTFKVGTTYTMTLHNVGTMGHNWAIVDAKSSTANVLFSAQIGTSSTPIAAGASQSVTFTPTQAGSFFYICQVDAHVSLGMWGAVTVNP
jgi:plastocyanin